MRIPRILTFGALIGSCLLLAGSLCPAQTGAGSSIEFGAYIRPAEGQPEPVRGMTFYLLSKSLSDIRREVAKTDGLVDLDHFVAHLELSPELKEWMTKHHRVDLAGDDFTKELTAEDVVNVPEFLSAYKDQNGSALHAIIPDPKFKKDEEQKYPEKYKLHLEQYHQALLHYIQNNLDSLQGLDAELRDKNPKPQWQRLESEQQRHLQQRVTQLARTRYFVAAATTDLNGRASFENLSPGGFWITNLDTPALAGDLRLHWDVPVSVMQGKSVRAELSDLNALETSEQDAN